MKQSPVPSPQSLATWHRLRREGNIIVTMRVCRRKWILLFALLALSQPVPTWSDNDLALYYVEQPPLFHLSEGGKVVGVLADIINAALESAQVRFHWEQVPAARILATIKNDKIAVCSPGKYWTVERQQFANYSAPMFVDPPVIAVVHEDALPLMRASITETLDGPVTLLLKDGWVYGAYLDGLINKLPGPQKTNTTADPLFLVKMVQARRAQMTLLSIFEAEYFIRQERINKVKIVQFVDIPRGEKRYLLCSKSVDAKTLVKINAALERQGRR